MKNLSNITSVCALSALLSSTTLPGLQHETTSRPAPEPTPAHTDARLPPSPFVALQVQLLATANEWVSDPRISKGYSDTAYRFLKVHPEAESLLIEAKQTQADVIAVGKLIDVVSTRSGLGYTATYAVTGVWGRHAKVGLISKDILQTHSLLDPRIEHGVESDIIYDTGRRNAEKGDSVLIFAIKIDSGELLGWFVKWPKQ